MAQKRGLIELRLDRRQAFYAVVGCLLIVSVAFVVGLIIGQRMQLIEDPADRGIGEPVNAEATESDTEPTAVAAAESEPDYTFYDELREQPPRPLLMPSRGGIGEPAEAVRMLERQPRDAEEPSTDDEPAVNEPEPESPPSDPDSTPDDPAREAQPAPQPERVAVAEPEPVREQVAIAEPNDGSARRIQRRTVRRDAPRTSAPDEFGFFTVEAGRFGSFAEASDRRTELRSQGHEAIVTIVVPASGEREYRVQIGSYTRRGEAAEVAASVGRLGISARVIQEG